MEGGAQRLVAMAGLHLIVLSRRVKILIGAELTELPYPDRGLVEGAVSQALRDPGGQGGAAVVPELADKYGLAQGVKPFGGQTRRLKVAICRAGGLAG